MCLLTVAGLQPAIFQTVLLLFGPATHRWTPTVSVH